MGTWIDFKQLRSQLNFADVMRHYNVEIKAKGTQHHGFCPLPNHNGKKNSQSFSANLEKGIFNCFGCGAKGNVLDFAALMEGKNAENGSEVREVAITLRDKFCGSSQLAPKTERKVVRREEAEQFELPNGRDEQSKSNVVVNAPLDFELKNLDPKHPYLDKRGFSPEIIAKFGLGYCSKGLLTGRIAIPIHDEQSSLVGYSGRLVDDRAISDEHPRYKFPPERKRGEVTYQFHKSALLYNSHRLKSPVDLLFIVEGFASVWWLTQMGFPDSVALMGWSMSDEQANAVARMVKPSGRVIVIPDGDKSGLQCAQSAFEHIASIRFLKWLKLDEGNQPTDYPGGWYREQIG